MLKGVCVHCGSDELFRNVEITIEGSSDLDVHINPDGTVTYSEGHTDDIGAERHEEPGDFECGACGATAATLAELVVPDADAGRQCACGHDLATHHRRQKATRWPCAEVACGCWNFEPDPELAIVRPEHYGRTSGEIPGATP